jgi:site-specific recombinase XerD
MPTAIAFLKTDYESKRGYPIIIRLYHNRIRNYNTGYRIEKKHWTGSEVKGTHPDADIINGVISGLLNKAKRYFADCIINEVPINLDRVFVKTSSKNFNDYLLHRAAQYKSKGLVIMWQKMTRFEKELQLHFKRKIFFDELTPDSLREFENYLISIGNHQNTRHKKFKFLRQLFQKGIEEGLHTGINPFKDHKINVLPSGKEKLTLAEIQALETADVTGPYHDARNLFLFAYYAKGARFENCVMLRREHIKDGRIYFVTNKGKKHITVLINSKIQKIIDQYLGEFVFPYVKRIPEDPFEYLKLKDSLNSLVNKYLKVVGATAGIKKKLTFHIARHSIAQHLKQSKTDINSIKDILGHSSTRTTEIYLASLDDEILDDEMRKITGE